MTVESEKDIDIQIRSMQRSGLLVYEVISHNSEFGVYCDISYIYYSGVKASVALCTVHRIPMLFISW